MRDCFAGPTTTRAHGDRKVTIKRNHLNVSVILINDALDAVFYRNWSMLYSTYNISISQRSLRFVYRNRIPQERCILTRNSRIRCCSIPRRMRDHRFAGSTIYNERRFMRFDNPNLNDPSDGRIFFRNRPRRFIRHAIFSVRCSS